MEQSELFAAPSPCIGVCENSPKGYCKGCMRSRDERFNWNQMTIAQKLQVIKVCAQRYQRMIKRRQAKAQDHQELNLELNLDAIQPQQTDLF